MELDDLTGAQAHAAGVPMSGCPFLPADPAGAAWRADWIAAEAQARYDAGTYGATDEDYRAGGLHPPDRVPDGAPVHVIGISLTPEERDALERAFRILGRAAADLVRKIASAGNVLQTIADALAQANADDIASATPNAPTCPRHGPKRMRGGACLRCQREQARRLR